MRTNPRRALFVLSLSAFPLLARDVYAQCPAPPATTTALTARDCDGPLCCEHAAFETTCHLRDDGEAVRIRVAATEIEACADTAPDTQSCFTYPAAAGRSGEPTSARVREALEAAVASSDAEFGATDEGASSDPASPAVRIHSDDAADEIHVGVQLLARYAPGEYRHLLREIRSIVWRTEYCGSPRRVDACTNITRTLIFNSDPTRHDPLDLAVILAHEARHHVTDGRGHRLVPHDYERDARLWQRLGAAHLLDRVLGRTPVGLLSLWTYSAPVLGPIEADE